MGPGLYSEIGKRARDLLYKGYHTDQKFSLTTYTATGVFCPKSRPIFFTHARTRDLAPCTLDSFLFSLMSTALEPLSSSSSSADDTRRRTIFPFSFLGRQRTRGSRKAITAAGTKKDELILGEIQSQLKNKNVTVDVKANSDSTLLTTFTVDELATTGLKSIVSFLVPDPKSGKIELQYLHDHAGVSGGFGLSTNPIIHVSSVLGTKTLAIGSDVAFDTASGNFTKYNAGISYNTLDFSTSLMVNEKGDQLSASYYHLVNPLFSTAVGAELAHRFSTAESILTFGTQHALDPLTTVKARINNYGKANALIEHEWRPKSFITISTEVDTRAIEKGSKVGLSLALKP